MQVTTQVFEMPDQKSLAALAEIEREEIMQTLRDAMYDYGDSGLLAIRAGVTKATVYNIRSGRTKWPRPTTMMRLLYVLDLKLVLVKRNK